jgi:NhaP-type Na+/H+ or K+/H+ antiporter
LLLAGPGVLWGAVIIAFMFKVLLGYDDTDLTWYEALALGSVLSATDPVAVVALLK